jgi:hypothetical protein
MVWATRSMVRAVSKYPLLIISPPQSRSERHDAVEPQSITERRTGPLHGRSSVPYIWLGRGYLGLRSTTLRASRAQGNAGRRCAPGTTVTPETPGIPRARVAARPAKRGRCGRVVYYGMDRKKNRLLSDFRSPVRPRASPRKRSSRWGQRSSLICPSPISRADCLRDEARRIPAHLNPTIKDIRHDFHHAIPLVR